MIKYIQKIPVHEYSVDRAYLDKIDFPAEVKEILDFRIINQENNKCINFLNNSEYHFATGIKAEKGDEIFISYIQGGLPDIIITLKISDIFQYSSKLYRYKNWIDSARIEIMDRSGYITNENPTKYIINIFEELFSVDADQIVIEGAEYLDIKHSDIAVNKKVKREPEITHYVSNKRSDYVIASDSYIKRSFSAERILLKMLRDQSLMQNADKHYVMYIERYKEVIDKLKTLASFDNDYIIKGFIVLNIFRLTLSILGDEEKLVSFLEEGLKNEEETWVKIIYYFALYITGKDKYLTYLLKGLDNDDDNIRCLVACLLSEAVNTENVNVLKEALLGRLKKEKPSGMVVPTFERVLIELDKYTTVPR